MTRKQPSLFPSLLPTDKAAPGEKKEADRPRAPKIALIDLNLVRPNPAEPRKTLNEEGLRQLADSIRRHGLLNPILVRREQHGTFTTLAGSRRLKACRELRQKTIPALVIDGDPLQISLIENLVREELNPVDEAETLLELKERGEFTLQGYVFYRVELEHGHGELRITDRFVADLIRSSLTYFGA